MNDTARWVPLRYYLRIQRRKHQTLTMTFRQIEAILGDGLPKPARRYEHWWANDPDSLQAHAWLDEGWLVASADLAAETVSLEVDPLSSRTAPDSTT